MPNVTLYPGDNRLTLRRLIDEGVRVHSVVCDPPYGLVSVQKRFGKEGSAAARTEGNDGSFARLSGGFMGKCFHPNTEIMTKQGWKRVDQIEVGEIVATLDPQSRDLIWQAVEQYHVYPFEGELVHIKHRSSEQMITPNHKMLVSFDGGETLKLSEPGELKSHFHIFAQANPSSGKTSSVIIESEREYGKDRAERRGEKQAFDAKTFFRFFGLWLGDGYTVTRSSDHPANDFFGINVKKERKKEIIRETLLSLGVRFTETASENGFSAFYIYNFALLGWLKQFGKAANKFIPEEFFEWDASCMEELYRGLIETDGTVQGPKDQEVFFTTSGRLADDFQRLCLQVGRYASVCYKPGGNPVVIDGHQTTTSDSWTCCVLQPRKRMYGEKSLSSSNVVLDFPYVGNVFCVGVPQHHIIYTRFNGKPVWTGNSWDGTGIERDPEFWKLIYEILLPGGYVFAFSGSRTGHWQACAMELAGFIMHPMHGWVFGCMDPETECLTRRGWLCYTDLLPTDEVLQWNSETDLLSWVVPQHIHEYDFDGQMVQIKNRHTHQVLTPNHRVYAKIRRHSRHAKPVAYEVIESRFVDSRPGNWQVNLPMASFLEGSQNFDVELAYLVGWWLTDAWAHKDANAVCFSQSKSATLAKLRDALSKWNPSEYVKKAKKATHADEHMIYLSGPLADLLRRDFPERKLTWDMLDWSIEARRALYEGLMDGDGSRKETQHAEAFWSKDQDRRDVFLALALSIGVRCYEDPVKGVVYVNQKTRTTQVQDKQRADRLPYKGKVWCLTVPTGAFVVRRSGRPFITGNSGFPKAHAADKAIDKMLGMKGGFVAEGAPVKRMIPGADQHRDGSWIKDNGREYQPGSYVPGSPEAAQWEGWAYGTQAQKPALEPIYLGQKPFSEKTGAANLLKHGVGAVNIDGCRVPHLAEDDGRWGNGTRPGGFGDVGADKGSSEPNGRRNDLGRHPANLLLDGSPEVVAMFPHGKSGTGAVKRKSSADQKGNTGSAYGAESRAEGTPMISYGDEGSSARFFHQFGPDTDPLFYHPKAGKQDRAGSKHPTVKPIALMQYLIRHITPPGGVVLDPFAGSGTTAEAARREGFDCILMEAEDEYVEFLQQRFDIGSQVTNSTLDLYLDLLGFGLSDPSA